LLSLNYGSSLPNTRTIEPCLPPGRLPNSEQRERGEIVLFKRFVRAIAAWGVANPVKAAQLAIALAILGSTLVTTKRLDRRALRRAARILL